MEKALSLNNIITNLVYKTKISLDIFFLIEKRKVSRVTPLV